MWDPLLGLWLVQLAHSKSLSRARYLAGGSRGRRKGGDKWLKKGWLQMTVQGSIHFRNSHPWAVEVMPQKSSRKLNLFGMWGVMGQGYNFPSSSGKAIGSMTFSPICLCLPYLQQSLCQICPGLQSVQSAWKSRWDFWLQIIPTGWGRLDKCCWGVAGTAEHGAWQDGARAAGWTVHALPLDWEWVPRKSLSNYLAHYLPGMAFPSRCCTEC